MPDRTATSDSPSRRHYQPLVVMLLALAAGILVDRLLGELDVESPLAHDVPGLWTWWIVALVALLVWWPLWKWHKLTAAMWPLAIALVALGGAWHHVRWNLFEPDNLGLFARQEAQPICLEAIALSGPRRVPAPEPNAMRAIEIKDRTRLEVAVRRVRDGATWRTAAGRSTVTIDGSLADVRAGDRLRIVGQLTTIHKPENPGGFDFNAYARADRQLAVVWSDFPECVTRLELGGWGWRRWLDDLRSRGDGNLWKQLDPSRSGLAAAMFLGLREELDPDQSQAFLETGTVHLLVISGLNVAILASCVSIVMRLARVPQRGAFLFIAVFTLLYAVITDAQPPVVRATIMVLMLCAARVLGRELHGYNVLAAAALVVLALNPAELFRAGTQLSFLSVAMLMWPPLAGVGNPPRDPIDRLILETRPWYERLLHRGGRITRRSLAASLLVWLFILPLVMFRFHLVTPAAVLLGPLLSIPVALAMGAGFGVLLLGWLPVVGDVFGWICDNNLWLLQAAVAWARTLPGNHEWVTGPAIWWTVGAYGLLLWWALAANWRPPLRWRWAAIALWIAAGLGLAAWHARPPGKLTTTFLSVGHGCAVLLELPGGQKVLYDAGRMGSPITPARAIAGYLWSRGISRLDAIVISHADADHYNAIPQLLQQFSVGALYVSPTMFDDIRDGVAVLHAAIERSGVPVKQVWSGDRLTTNDACQIEVLHPPRQGILGSDNANSVVLSVEYAGRKMLLTGGLEAPGIYDVMSEEPAAFDVLLAPHHGSSRSDPPGFSRWASPKYVVVSSGETDNIDFVTTTYAKAGSVVLPTSELGAVRVEMSERALDVQNWNRDDSEWLRETELVRK